MIKTFLDLGKSLQRGSQNWSQLVQNIICGNGKESFFWNTLEIIFRVWRTKFQFLAEDFHHSCPNCFLHVLRKDLGKTICFEPYRFINISRRSSKTVPWFLAIKTGTVEKTEFYLSRGTSLRHFFWIKLCNSVLWSLEETFWEFGQLL